MTVRLRDYDRRGYDPGGGRLSRAIWYVLNALLMRSSIPGSGFRRLLLRAFGATIGERVVLKPRVNVKYPWHLSIGDDAWIGEDVWIDNLTKVTIERDVCVSQQAYLLTGNHDYTDPCFGLITEPIQVGRGAWIGARATVCPGTIVAEHAIVTVGSVLNGSTEPYGVYRGNPAVRIRERVCRPTENARCGAVAET